MIFAKGKDVYSGGKPVVSLDDIVKLYHRGKVKLSNDAKHYLFDLANKLGDGSLRRCKLLVMNAVRRARKRQELGPDAPVTIMADDLAYVETRFRQEDAEQ